MLIFFIFITSAIYIQAQQEGSTNIESYPHSVFLSVMCFDKYGDLDEPWSCGSSLVNQQILLTAGHCVTPCEATMDISINMGDVNRDRGVVRRSRIIFLHENYDDRTLEYDIALIKIRKAVRLTPRVRRVAIMKRPPYNEPATVAGWGLTEINHLSRFIVKMDQKVANHSFCMKRLGDLPDGTFCASSNKISLAEQRSEIDNVAHNANDYDHPIRFKMFAKSFYDDISALLILDRRGSFTVGSRYDSGSALVVRGYIQIGLVSFKSPGVDNMSHLIVYTDVGYFYNWIASRSRILYCEQ